MVCLSNVDIPCLHLTYVLNWFLLQLTSMSQKSYVPFFLNFIEITPVTSETPLQIITSRYLNVTEHSLARDWEKFQRHLYTGCAFTDIILTFQANIHSFTTNHQQTEWGATEIVKSVVYYIACTFCFS
jgi:hypothetical protein